MNRAALMMMMRSGDHGRKEAYTETHEMHDHKLTRADAERWVSCMLASDGKKILPPWTMDHITQYIRQHNWSCDPVELWAIMIALWSDHCRVAQKFGVDNIDFWADLAKSWLDDPDAMPDKAGRYYKYIAKH